MRIEFTGNWALDAGVYGAYRVVKETIPSVLFSVDDENSVKRLKEEGTLKIPKALLYYSFFIGIVRRKIVQSILPTVFGSDVSSEAVAQYNTLSEGAIANCVKQNNKLLSSDSFKPDVLAGLIYHSALDLLRIVLSVATQYPANRGQLQSVQNMLSSGKLPLTSNYLHNWEIFNPSKLRNPSQVRNNLARLLQKLESLSDWPVDKAPYKFVFSLAKFPNITYLVAELSEEKLDELPDTGAVFPQQEFPFFLFYDFAFVLVTGKNLFLYSSNPYLLVSLNDSLREKLAMARDTGRSLFRVTIDSVIDGLLKTKAVRSLERIYLIEHEGIKNQELQKVEYIPFSVTLAHILLNDSLRYVLNADYSYLFGNKEKRTWLLEDLITGRAYDVVLRHVAGYVSGKIDYLNKRSSIAALVSDAVIREWEVEVAKRHVWYFDPNSSRSNIAERVISIIRHVYAAGGELGGLEKNELKRLADLTKTSPYAFANEILRRSVGHQVKYLPSFVTNYVLSSPFWRNYALSLVIAAEGKGGGGGESA